MGCKHGGFSLNLSLRWSSFSGKSPPSGKLQNVFTLRTKRMWVPSAHLRTRSQTMMQTWNFCRRMNRSPSCCHAPVYCITRVSLCSERWNRCLGIPSWGPSMQSSNRGLSQPTRGAQAPASSGWWVWITSFNLGGMRWMNSAPQWLMCLRSNKKPRSPSSQQAEVSEQHICSHCLQSCKKKKTQ